MSCVEKKFELQVRKWEEYKGTRNPSAGSDDTSAPVAMLVNSNELRTTDFPLTEVTWWLAEAVVRAARQ
jgi:hypothetical protein